MNRFIILEPLCREYEHLTFNAALLTSLAMAFPDAKFEFFGESRHLHLIKGEINNEIAQKIEWRPISVPDPNDFYPKKIAMQFSICREVFRAAQKQKAPIIAFSASELTLVMARLLMSFGFGKIHFAAILHSLIKYLSENSCRGFRAKIAGKIIIPLALKFSKHPHIRLIVLSSFIRERFVQIMPSMKSNTHYIDMPYIFSPPVIRDEKREKIIVGFAGVGTREKGIDVFLHLAQDLQGTASASGRQAVFSVIGRLGRDCGNIAIPDCVITQGGTGLLSQEEFDRAISQCACLVFPYDQRHYELVASASLMDAVRHQKPVLAYRTPFFEGYLGRLGKEAGRICDNYEELKQAALEFIQNYEQRRPINHDEYYANARRIFSPEAIAPQLKKILEDW